MKELVEQVKVMPDTNCFHWKSPYDHFSEK